MSEPLKPCPFCGGLPDLKSQPFGTMELWYVVCLNEPCIMCPSTASCESEEQAIAAWNTRHHPEPTLEQVERVAMAMNDSLAEEDHHEWQNLDDWIKRDFLSQARAAIKAMKAKPAEAKQ